METIEQSVLDYRKKVFDVCEDNIRNGVWRKIIINDLLATQKELANMDKMEPFIEVIKEAVEIYETEGKS